MLVDFDGSVYPGTGEGTVEELLDLAEKLITLTSAMECTDLSGVCPKPLIAAENLSWLSVLELMVVGGVNDFLDLFTAGSGALPAYEIDCMGSILIETLCEGETSALLELVNGMFEGTFNAAELAAEGLEITCGSQANAALQEGSEEITVAGKPTEEIDVSEKLP